MNYSFQSTQPIMPNNLGDPVGDDNAQQYRRQIALGRSLLGQQANPATPFAGLANLGSSIAGANMMQSATNRYQDQLAHPGLQPVRVTPAMNSSFFDRARNSMGNLFGFGGGGG